VFVVRLRPAGERVERWAQRAAERRQRVVGAVCARRADSALDEPIALELPQLLGQHLVTDAGDAGEQRVEPARAAAQLPEDVRFPLAAHDVERESHRAGVGASISAGATRHGRVIALVCRIASPSVLQQSYALFSSGPCHAARHR